MLPFTKRPFGFKLGLVMMVTGLLLYVIGFSSSYWTVYEVSFYSSGFGDNLSDPWFIETVNGHNGLWETCGLLMGFSSQKCVAVSHEKNPAWVPAVQGTQCMGLVTMIAACAFALVVNFIKRSPNINNRYLEILLIVSGVLAFIGSTIYAAASNGNESILMVNDDSGLWSWVMKGDAGIHRVVDKNDLSWGYVLNLIGWFLALVSAVLLCANNRLNHELGNPGSSGPVGAVSFSPSAGGSGGGRLEFIPPQHLAGGFVPPEVPSQSSEDV
ncbi:uncharacterized protein [Littorina saxatilis]|uniref:Uncharacterized protein n=1 Tax=Littorina saxatilis TaxID=31220 RepID=A0AAN9BXA7_9CAEN